MKQISSAQNPLVKLAASLHKPRERRKQGLFAVEGLREIRLAVLNGYTVRTLLFCDSDLQQQPPEALLGLPVLPDAELAALSRPVFDSLVYRQGVPNALALCVLADLPLDRIRLRPDPLLLVLESVEKPGNLGAMLRTADAAGADAVIVADPLTDPDNPNVIRSSLGARFTVQVAAAPAAEVIAWLRSRQIRIFASSLQASEWHDRCDFRPASALVMGPEAEGLSGIWYEAADARIKIPMLGQVDSLNVSASAAVLLFEAVRQRRAASAAIPGQS